MHVIAVRGCVSSDRVVLSVAVVFDYICALFEECSSWILMVPTSKRDHALSVHHALPEIRQRAFSPSAVLCTQLI
jgi:hypothetical protein